MSDVAALTSQRWDALIIGAGMGGATLGYALARAGWRVLLVDKGRAASRYGDTLRGAYAETFFDRPEPVGTQHADVLRRAGREWQALLDATRGAPRAFIPFVGSGSGGSSALYGMVLERFFPEDFEPRRFHRDAPAATLPERWPVSYADLAPWYAAAEMLYGVRSAVDPLRPRDAMRAHGAAAAGAPAFSPPAQEIADLLAERGLHPYHLPLACAYVAQCAGCQGYLCARGCKQDSATACLAPAMERYGAALIDECEALRIDTDGERVVDVLCRHRGQTFRLRAGIVALAAGALQTPALLLRSASAHWPAGLANRSGLVGKNLMRHFVDLYAVFTRTAPDPAANAKELGCSDLYVTPQGKLGSLQSFGAMPSAPIVVASMEHDVRHAYGGAAAAAFRTLAAPLLRVVLSRLFARAVVLATIVEDLPYADNEVTLAGADPGTAAVAVRYRIDARAAARIGAARDHVRALLAPRRHLLIRQAESNERLAHACGTCRFGTDPATSVLDVNNKAHDVANLYVVDAAFFPSSGGTNPALTIAANALRVGAQLAAQGRP